MITDEKNRPLQDEQGRHLEGEGRRDSHQTHPRPGPQLLNPEAPVGRLLVAGDPPRGFTRLGMRHGKMMYRGPGGRFYNLDQMRQHFADSVPSKGKG